MLDGHELARMFAWITVIIVTATLLNAIVSTLETVLQKEPLHPGALRYYREAGFKGGLYPINPTRSEVQGLKAYPGTDPRVSSWVLERNQTQEFLARLESLLGFLIPQYRAEGKSYLTVSIGCTGGRHRSVALSEELGKRLSEKNRANVKVSHRDVNRV